MFVFERSRNTIPEWTQSIQEQSSIIPDEIMPDKADSQSLWSRWTRGASNKSTIAKESVTEKPSWNWRIPSFSGLWSKPVPIESESLSEFLEVINRDTTRSEFAIKEEQALKSGNLPGLYNQVIQLGLTEVLTPDNAVAIFAIIMENLQTAVLRLSTVEFRESRIVRNNFMLGVYILDNYRELIIPYSPDFSVVISSAEYIATQVGKATRTFVNQHASATPGADQPGRTKPPTRPTYGRTIMSRYGASWF